MSKGSWSLLKRYLSSKKSKKAIKDNVSVFLEKNKRKNNFNIFNHKWKVLCVFASILGFSIYIIYNHGFNKGVDFTGGLVVEASCKECDNGSKIIEQTKEKLKISINYQKIENGYLFKTNATKNYNKILAEFETILNQNNAKIIMTNFSSPQITKTFIEDSLIACVFAIVCISLYMIIRFNWKFAISAIIALITDILLVAAFISIKQLEVCLITLTAILTIIGYNINDKIIIFDYIRCNLDLTNISISEVIKKSAKNVLFRSILTSATTIIATVSTLFFDDRAIRELGLIVIYGIVIGTISSLLLAPNLLLAFRIKHKSKQTVAKDPMWYAS